VTSSRSEIARSLLLEEAGRAGIETAEGAASGVLRVWARFAHRFGRLIGGGGIRALQDRSISVAAVRFTWLTPPPEGFGDDWQALRTAFESRTVTEGVAGFEEVVAALVALLGRFIGDALVGHLLHEMWPGVFPGDPKEPM